MSAKAIAGISLTPPKLTHSSKTAAAVSATHPTYPLSRGHRELEKPSCSFWKYRCLTLSKSTSRIVPNWSVNINEFHSTCTVTQFSVRMPFGPASPVEGGGADGLCGYLGSSELAYNATRGWSQGIYIAGTKGKALILLGDNVRVPPFVFGSLPIRFSARGPLARAVRKPMSSVER